MNDRTFIATSGNGTTRAISQNGDWSVESSLTDRAVHTLAADPCNPNVVYAGTQGDGVLRSIDCGGTWHRSGLSGQTVKALATSRLRPGVVYAATMPPALFVSDNAGGTWVELDALRRARRWYWFSPSERLLVPYVQAIALSPTDPNVIVVGIEAGAVLRTSDGGKTWEGHRPGAVRDCHSLSFHPTNGDWVYEAGGTGAAFSRDGGKTWRQPRAGLDRRYGWACAADPARPEVWYVSASPLFDWSSPVVPVAHIDGKANACIYRSAGGAAWQALSGGLPQPLAYMAYALLTDPRAPGHLYAGLSNGDVWHATDHGDTWMQLPFNLRGIHRTLIML